MKDLAEKLKAAFILGLVRNEQIADKPYLVAGRRSYSRRQIAEEIEKESEFGVEILRGALAGALEIMTREAARPIAP